MTKSDGWGNLYRLAEPKTYQVPHGKVAVHKNNDRGHTFVDASDWKKWEEVRTVIVEQKGLEI